MQIFMDGHEPDERGKIYSANSGTADETNRRSPLQGKWIYTKHQAPDCQHSGYDSARRKGIRMWVCHRNSLKTHSATAIGCALLCRKSLHNRGLCRRLSAWQLSSLPRERIYQHREKFYLIFYSGRHSQRSGA